MDDADVVEVGANFADSDGTAGQAVESDGLFGGDAFGATLHAGDVSFGPQAQLSRQLSLRPTL